jgi:hypothetical protein
MRTFRKGMALVAALWTLAPVAVHAQSLDAAKAFVAGLYAGYRHGEPDYLSRRNAPRIFAPKLLDLIRRDEVAAKGEVGILDGDPICDCQDAGGLKVRSLAVAAAGAGQARAQAVINLDGDVRHLTLDLAAQGGGWRIADVHSADTPSLVKMLEDGLKAEEKPHKRGR